MINTIFPNRVEILKQELAQVRDSSIRATRRGDYRTVARLTAEAAQINRQINEFSVGAQV